MVRRNAEKLDAAIKIGESVLYSSVMTLDIQPERLDKLAQRLRDWATHLQGTGIGGLLGALLGAAAPLSPLGAQMLWIAQPLAGLFGSGDEIDTLARLLSAPEGVRWLRATLSGGTSDDESDSGEGDT